MNNNINKPGSPPVNPIKKDLGTTGFHTDPNKQAEPRGNAFKSGSSDISKFIKGRVAQVKTQQIIDELEKTLPKDETMADEVIKDITAQNIDAPPTLSKTVNTTTQFHLNELPKLTLQVIPEVFADFNIGIEPDDSAVTALMKAVEWNDANGGGKDVKEALLTLLRIVMLEQSTDDQQLQNAGDQSPQNSDTSGKIHVQIAIFNDQLKKLEQARKQDKELGLSRQILATQLSNLFSPTFVINLFHKKISDLNTGKTNPNEFSASKNLFERSLKQIDQLIRFQQLVQLSEEQKTEFEKLMGKADASIDFLSGLTSIYLPEAIQEKAQQIRIALLAELKKLRPQES